MMSKLFATYMMAVFLFTGCSSYISSSGPNRSQVNSADGSDTLEGIQIVDVDHHVARQLVESHKLNLFSEIFEAEPRKNYLVGAGDVIEVMIWEAPPRALFQGDGAVILPHQMVTDKGEINIPFAGQVPVGQKTTQEIESEIGKRLRGKANQPQVMVRLISNNTANVTIVGDVNQSRQLPLTYRGERLMDALAAAGGVRQEVNKTTLQITRGNLVQSLPLDTVIRDPKQNIRLMPGDIVTSLYKSYSFTVLGATGQNGEVNFEAQGISLAQALARSGGLSDTRADAEGVYIFRFEKPKTLKLDESKVKLTPEGLVPVVYRVDMKDPATFFVAQNFPIEHKDVIFVANSSQAQTQKFLNLIQSIAFSTLGVINLQTTLDKTMKD